MAEKKKRKLAAIFSADVAGYSRLMADDEEATVNTINVYRAVMTDLIQRHDGRVVDAKGDNVLAEFSSVVDTVRCAAEVQRELKTRNADLPEHRKMEFRIGVNLGDVIEEEGTIYGDGVNVAARLEGLAEGGGICISGTAFDQVKNRIPVGYAYQGKQSVKNIPDPIRVYKVLLDPEHAGQVIGELTPKPKRWLLAVAAIAIIIAAGAWQVWHFYFRPPPIEPASVEKMAYPLPDKPSIAILPFENFGSDPGREYLPDAITENITSALSRVPELFVIARNSSFTYKGKPVKVQKVAEDLGVRYVLEGSVQISGNSLRVTAQLIDAVKGYHLWSERYDRKLKDIFALQDDIALQIVASLRVKLTAGEQARVGARGTENLEAYLKLLQASESFFKVTREGNALARRLAEEVITLDPKFPGAYALLGGTYFMDVPLGLSKSQQESYKQAFQLTQKAIHLDESYATAYPLLGWLYVIMGRQYDRGIAECDKAIALSPNLDAGYIWKGFILAYAGRPSEAIRFCEKALRLNPMPPGWFFRALGVAYAGAGNYEEAIAAFKKSLQRAPHDILTHADLAVTYSWADRPNEARAQFAELHRINPKFSVEELAKWVLYKNQADRQRYLEGLRKAGLPDKPPLPLPDKPSIAVLPFVNMSADPGQEYFADGMTDDLITDLSKLSGILVIARNSTFTYKGKQVKVQKVSQDLGARYVVEGSVRKAGNDIRINAQLIDATTGHHLWAERYDVKMQNIFALQDEITRKIVSSLAVKLGTSAQKDKRPETENIEAYDALLKGYGHYLRGTIDDAVMAISYFEKAIELDPDYGRAYAALAKTYFLGPKIRREWYAKTGLNYQKSMLRARHYLKKANKNPTSTSHQIASLMALQRRLYEEAMAEAELALLLEQNGVESNFNMGYVLVFLGRAEEGIGYLKRSIELDPLHPGWTLFYTGLARFSMGQFDEAVALINRALTYNPDTHKMLGILAAAYGHLGRAKEARDNLLNYLRGFPARPDLNAIMADWPFKDPKDADCLAEGLIKAGLPGQASDYYKILKENKLTGEEIRKLLFGRTRSGYIYGHKGVPYSVSCTKDGKVEYMDAMRYDTGKSWIEGDTLFLQFGTLYGGLEISVEVYRNPGGTLKNLDEYLIINDWGVYPSSVVD